MIQAETIRLGSCMGSTGTLKNGLLEKQWSRWEYILWRYNKNALELISLSMQLYLWCTLLKMFLFFIYFGQTMGLWDLSSPIRDLVLGHGCESTESSHWTTRGTPWCTIWNAIRFIRFCLYSSLMFAFFSPWNYEFYFSNTYNFYMIQKSEP